MQIVLVAILKSLDDLPDRINDVVRADLQYERHAEHLLHLVLARPAPCRACVANEDLSHVATKPEKRRLHLLNLHAFAMEPANNSVDDFETVDGIVQHDALIFLNSRGNVGRDSVAWEHQKRSAEFLDSRLPALFDGLPGNTIVVLCADHGEAFGEDGYWGHGVNHPTVLTVPLAIFRLDRKPL